MNSMQSMSFDSVIFDLDGTLWDETGVTAETWVEVMKRHPDIKSSIPLTADNVRKYMGLTNEELAGVFFPELPFDAAFSLMTESCELENKWLPERGGRLYDGVEAGLERLRKCGKKLFIVSNCQDGYIEAFLTAHRLESTFTDYLCSGKTGMPKSDNIREIILRSSLDSPVYVGDTISDSTAARKAELPFIYAKYGFGEQCGRGRTDDYDFAAHTFEDIVDFTTAT